MSLYSNIFAFVTIVEGKEEKKKRKEKKRKEKEKEKEKKRKEKEKEKKPKNEKGVKTPGAPRSRSGSAPRARGVQGRVLREALQKKW